jgi:hypothetical protein
MLPWVVATGAAVLALVALLLVRGLRRRIEHLTQSYWELRYDYTRLRSDLARLDPSARVEPAEPQAPVSGFIPLASLKGDRPSK